MNAITERVEADIRREDSFWRGYSLRGRLGAALSAGRPAPAVEEWTPPNAAAEEARWFNYFDELGTFTQPEQVEELSRADRCFAFSAQGRFLAMAREKTGATVKPELNAKKRAAKAALIAQSVEIADRMKAAGWNAYRETPFEIHRILVHSGERETLTGFRRSCFIPSVAEALRRPYLAALEYWLSRNLGARFWTFSSGIRVQLSGVRDRVKWLHAKLEELNSQPFMKAAGARLVFRATELGTPEQDESGEHEGGEVERDETGQLWFHVHAHCVVELAKGFVRPEKWSKLLEKVGKFWVAADERKAWWGEGGRIRNGKECCKYVTKPGEMLKLDGPELVALQEQLFRLKLVQPMGSLAAEMRARENPACRKRLVTQKTPDGTIWKEEKDWNVHPRKTKEEAAAAWEARKGQTASARRSQRVISLGLPVFNSKGIAEPVVTVMATRGSLDVAAVMELRFVKRLVRVTAEAYRDGVNEQAVRVPAISVHTRTPTPELEPAGAGRRPRGKPKRARMGAERAGY